MPDKQTGPDIAPAPPLQMPPPSSTRERIPDGADPRRLGELWNDWLGIQLDTIDSLTADAAAKVDSLPDLQHLWLLFGEVVVRLHAVELEVQRLKGGQR